MLDLPVLSTMCAVGCFSLFRGLQSRTLCTVQRMLMSTNDYKRFEDTNHASLYAKERFSYPPDLKKAILDYIGDQPKSNLLDVGCGSGQSTSLLADHFENVIGIDPSEAQISFALKNNRTKNITYRIGSASELPCENETIDMVTVASALHWFNIPEFYEEVRRVLKPGGVVAVWSIYYPRIDYPGYPKESTKTSEVLHKMMDGEWVEQGWTPKMAAEAFNSDRWVPCFDNEERFTSKFVLDRTLDRFMEIFKTFSGYQKIMKANPEWHYAEEVKEKFLKALGSPQTEGETQLKIIFPLFMMLSRKS